MDPSNCVELENSMNKFITFVRQQKQNLIESEENLRKTKLEFQRFNSTFESEITSAHNLKEEIECYNEECKTLINTLHDIRTENKEIQKDILKALKLKPSNNDTERLTHGHEKYNLYKTLTGIRWDYRIMDESIKGVTTNKKDYIHLFNYPMDTKNICNKIWEEIHNSVRETEIN